MLKAQDHIGVVYQIVSKFATNLQLEFDDIVQEVLVRILKSAPRYSSDKGKPSTFVALIAKSTCLDLLRQQNRRIARIGFATHAVLEEATDYCNEVLWSDDATQVVQMFSEGGKRSRESMTRDLRAQGWSLDKINRVFSEIRENISTEDERRAYTVSN